MPRSYVPTLLGAQAAGASPGFSACSASLGALIAAFRAQTPPRARAILFAVALAADPADRRDGDRTRPAMYNGVRHFVFVLPPLAVAGGLAGAWLATGSRATAALAPSGAGRARRHLRRRHRAAGDRHGAAASLRIRLLQSPRRRRARRAAALHARLLGPRLQAGGAGAARQARRARRDAARRPQMEDRGVRPASAARRSRSATSSSRPGIRKAPTSR